MAVSNSPVMITLDLFNSAPGGEYILIVSTLLISCSAHLHCDWQWLWNVQKICPSDVRSRLDDSPNGRSYDHESMDCELIKKCESSLCRHPYNKFLSTASKPSFIIVRDHSCKNLHFEIRCKLVTWRVQRNRYTTVERMDAACLYGGLWIFCHMNLRASHAKRVMILCFCTHRHEVLIPLLSSPSFSVHSLLNSAALHLLHNQMRIKTKK